LSVFDQIEPTEKGAVVTLHEGRNRQVRRAFAAVGLTVTKLTRTSHGEYHLDAIKSGSYDEFKPLVAS